MRTQAILNILFLFMVLTYQLAGKHDSIRWGNLFYIFLYLNLLFANRYFYQCATGIYKKVMLATIVYFLFSLLMEIICFIWTDLYYVMICKTHIILSGSALLILIFFILTYKSLR